MTQIPAQEIYRDVDIHNAQEPERVALVKIEIDTVLEISDLDRLSAWITDVTHAPESRLLALRMCEAAFEMSARSRMLRPDVDLDALRAHCAGLDTIRGRSKTHYSSIFAPRTAPGAPVPVARKIPLSESRTQTGAG